MLGGPTARLLIITAGWTGCRWGELTGLHRRNVDLRRGVIIIDQHHGALHESSGTRWIGPPKTASSARRIPLPPFLTDLLREHLAGHPHEYVFTTRRGTWLWRSTFDRRIFRPAADGNLKQANPKIRTTPACPGLTFHGLRHSHNTWMITDDTPEIARSRRLSHHLDNRLVETYSHVSGPMQHRLIACLQHRWNVATGTATDEEVPALTLAPHPRTVTGTDETSAASTNRCPVTAPSSSAAHDAQRQDDCTHKDTRPEQSSNEPRGHHGTGPRRTTDTGTGQAPPARRRTPRHESGGACDQAASPHHNPQQTRNADHQGCDAPDKADSSDIHGSEPTTPDDGPTRPFRDNGHAA